MLILVCLIAKYSFPLLLLFLAVMLVLKYQGWLFWVVSLFTVCGKPSQAYITIAWLLHDVSRQDLSQSLAELKESRLVNNRWSAFNVVSSWSLSCCLKCPLLADVGLCSFYSLIINGFSRFTSQFSCVRLRNLTFSFIEIVCYPVYRSVRVYRQQDDSKHLIVILKFW